MITIIDRPIAVSLLVHFVVESTLEYATDADVDGRLACYARGAGRWAVAWSDRAAAGIACLVTLDDGPHQGERCLYWLEVLPAFQGQGIGQALLAWASAQVTDTALVIAATAGSAGFYRRYLANWTEPTINTFLVKGGVALTRDERIATCRGSNWFSNSIRPLSDTTDAGRAPAECERSTF